VFGFKKLETPQSFGDFNVTWLHLPPIYSLHVVERDPDSRLPESPFVVPSDAKYVTSYMCPLCVSYMCEHSEKLPLFTCKCFVATEMLNSLKVAGMFVVSSSVN
jgi:hypothetical protein